MNMADSMSTKRSRPVDLKWNCPTLKVSNFSL